MIVTFDELRDLRGTVSMIDGAFDPLHAGHIAYIHAAAKFGRPLLCNVAADDYVRRKHAVLLPAAQRVAVINALRDVSYTHLNEHNTATVLAHLRPYAYIKGCDWKGQLPAQQVELCEQLGTRIVFLDSEIKESSSRLLVDYGTTLK